MTGFAAAAIPAAGRGLRAGGAPKQFRDLAGSSVLARAVAPFARRSDIRRIVVACAPGAEDDTRAALGSLAAAAEIVEGGGTRTASVGRCLEALAAGDAPAVVLIHDAARPLLADVVIDRVMAGLATADGAAPAAPLADALKTVSDDGLITGARPRGGVSAVQTPQGFRFGPLLDAYRGLAEDAAEDDDVAVALGAGLTVRAVEADPANFKITGPADFTRAARAFAQPGGAGDGGTARLAVGAGFDVHRLVPGDGLTLCGVKIPGGLALSGHSDADVALHALTDAILGALASGDIGSHFPPSDPRWAGADSRLFLAHARDLAAQAGLRIAHADLTIICERPKVGPHRDAMRAATAEVLRIPAAQVSVKATTTERLGFLGRGEGVAAQATALLVAA